MLQNSAGLCAMLLQINDLNLLLRIVPQAKLQAGLS